MLTRAQEKEIRSLHDSDARWEQRRCLVEGRRFVEDAGDAVEMVFTPADTPRFAQLVTTNTPQDVAAVARMPEWTVEDVCRSTTMVVLDGVQDPGNVGAALRLCEAFDASLVLVDCADPSNAKVIRASASAFFRVPWLRVQRSRVQQEVFDRCADRTVYRLEKRKGAQDVATLVQERAHSVLLIVGSEGNGIQLQYDAPSLVIPQSATLESLNVTHALAVALYVRYSAQQ